MHNGAHVPTIDRLVSQVLCIAPRGRNVAGLAAVLAVALVPGLVTAQSTGSSQGSSSQDDPAIRFRMPTVTVTAQKEPEDKQRVPVSVTAVSKDTIDSAGIHIVSEAAIFAPNTFFTEWSARKLSNARFRGISSSPNNPGITTYIDGVPQLSANSSSIELLDVNQIEFVRGPQSALFGRNTLGGLVNITSVRPSVSTWTGSLSVPFGNHGSWAVRGGVSGPIVSTFPTTFLTVIVAIDAADASNAATEVFLGYHNQGCLTPRDGMYHQLSDDAVDLSKGVVLELAPGDIAMFSGYTPHRSGPNRWSQGRRFLYLSYHALSDGGEQRAQKSQTLVVYLRPWRARAALGRGSPARRCAGGDTRA